LRYLERQLRNVNAQFDPSPQRERILTEMREWHGEIAGAWRRFYPLCEKALTIPGVTAWVGAEDWIATKALVPFLERERLSVPRDVSLLGFNNTLESLSCRLTSYEFNAVGAGMAAIDLFVFPESRRSFVDKSNNNVRIPGYMVDRGSVGVIEK
jgi:DNA-binding LacI/PurR family transcriptional regulator